jgi:hypothetical protein
MLLKDLKSLSENGKGNHEEPWELVVARSNHFDAMLEICEIAQEMAEFIEFKYYDRKYYNRIKDAFKRLENIK